MTDIKVAGLPLNIMRKIQAGARRLKRPSKNLLFGAGELPEGTKRIIGRWGGLDQDLFDATALQKQMERSGVTDSMPFFAGEGVDRHKLRAFEDALPGWGESIKGVDTDGLIKRMGDQGVNLSPEQAAALGKQHSFGRKAFRSAKSMYLGDAPLTTTYQRALQGGLFGKGGVIFGDLAPTPDLQRRAKGTWDALQKGNYGEAWKEAPLAHTAGFGLNAAMGYGVPLWLGAEAYQGAAERGENPLSALGSSVTSTLGSIAAAPLGLAQMQIMEPMERYSRKLWGLESDATGDVQQGNHGVATQRLKTPAQQDRRAQWQGQHVPLPGQQRPQAQPRPPGSPVTPDGRVLRKMTSTLRGRPSGYQAALNRTAPSDRY